jgi:hypothetical protein
MHAKAQGLIVPLSYRSMWRCISGCYYGKLHSQSKLHRRGGSKVLQQRPIPSTSTSCPWMATIGLAVAGNGVARSRHPNFSTQVIPISANKDV